MKMVTIAVLIFAVLGNSLMARPRAERSHAEEGGEQAEHTQFRAEGYENLFASEPWDDFPPEFLNQAFPASREFGGDYSRALVSFADILSGGPPKDGIPAIDEPRFIDREAVDWLGAQESILLYEGENVLRIYPIQILMYHEIVNDVVDGLPLAITYCPLCNTGVAFATLDYRGEPLSLGVSGRLRFSNMIMYDRQTESWWQQGTGRSITGSYAGSQLRILPLQLISWSQAQDYSRELNKPLEILSRETGHSRRYGRNPYPGYDKSATPFLYRGPQLSDEFDPLERVLAVMHKEQWTYLPFSRLSDERLVMLTLAGDPIIFIYDEGVNSPLDGPEVSSGRDVGSARAYLATHEGNALAFSLRADGLLEDRGGTVWTRQGLAQSGPLKGSRLANLSSVNHFWFSWTSFLAELE